MSYMSVKRLTPHLTRQRLTSSKPSHESFNFNTFQFHNVYIIRSFFKELIICSKLTTIFKFTKKKHVLKLDKLYKN